MGKKPHGLTGWLFVYPAIIATATGVSALVIKYLSEEGVWLQSLEDHHAVLRNGTIWSGVTSLVGFLIVFRVSQGYNRFWSGITAAHLFSAEWIESCSSLISMSRMSKKSESDQKQYRHLLVRLYSLLHASAMYDLIDGSGVEFPMMVLDSGSLDPNTVKAFESAYDRTFLVSHWIHNLITDGIADGTISAPPPLVSRVFQELGGGMVKYHDAMKAKDVKFPTVYALICVLILVVVNIILPWIIASWVRHWWLAALFAFVVSFAFWSLMFMAMALEKPFNSKRFWTDANRLQAHTNSRLVQIVALCSGHMPSLVADCTNVETMSVTRFTVDETSSGCSEDDDDGSADKVLCMLTGHTLEAGPSSSRGKTAGEERRVRAVDALKFRKSAESARLLVNDGQAGRATSR